jgi:hypothetical protein
MNADPKSGRRRFSHPIYPALLLLALFGLLVFSIRYKSPTADEQNHLARGLAYLKTGDLRLSQEHPPGINAWAAWSLLLDPRIHLPLESASWANAEWYGFADQLFWRANPGVDAQAMIFCTRVPVMWLTLLLAALAYRWARDLGGVWAGGIALALLAFDPNLLAHGRLTTNDVGLTCTVLAASYTLWRALRAPTVGSAALAGAALGAALLSKFSALVLAPIAAVILVVAWIGFGRDHPGAMQAHASVGRRALRLVLVFGVAGLVVWAGYAFSWGPTLGNLPGPAPAFWSGIQAILDRTGRGSPAFLLGQYSATGWWYYFFVAFAVKTPLATLVLLTLGAGLALCRASFHTRRPKEADKRRVWKPALLCLVLPPLAFWAMAVAGSFNIGYRHILPSLPFFYILASWSLSRPGFERLRVATRHPDTRLERRVWKPALQILGPDLKISPLQISNLALLLWLALNTLLLAPHYLAHFNLLAGGSDNGYRVLVDSNLDWGQDLPGLARAMRERGEERVFLSWFGAAHPEAYDLSVHPLPGFWRFGGEAAAYGYNPLAPAPGLYAISATNLQGVKLRDRDLYAWFRYKKREAHVGHSILLYRVEPAPDATERVVLAVPLAQLATEERYLLEQTVSVRQYDPRTGLIVPGGSGDLWYLSPQPPEGSEIVREGPGYLVARMNAVEKVQPPSLPSGDGSFGYVHPLDVRLGVDADVPGETLTIVVRWSVDEPPHLAATSFAHLLDAQGVYLAGWDGLTAPATCWQAGDWIEQRYPIPLPPDLHPGTYPIEVGWYDSDTGQRWAYTVGGEVVGDRWLLEWKNGKVEDRKTGRASAPLSSLPAPTDPGRNQPSSLPKDPPT